jgi:hypothetical protein
MAVGIGSGEGRSAYFLDNAGAQSRAHDAAIAEASENLNFAVRGAKCPACGKYNRAARAQAYVSSALRGVPLGALIGFFIVVVFQGSKAGWWTGAIAAVIVALGITIMRTRRMLEGAIFETAAGTAVGPSKSSKLGLY